MPTLIFCRENAQLGNRLIIYAHLLAAAHECGWKLINPTFEPYADHFVGTQSRPHGRSLFAVRALWQLGKLCAPLSGGWLARARARGSLKIDLETTLPTAVKQGTRYLLLQGYDIRCPTWVTRQADALRAFFMPVETFREPAESCLTQLRKPDRIIVGIHIRHGDYAEHLGGRFFYTFAQYAHIMAEIQGKFAPQTVAFLISTHVPIPAGTFTGFTWKSAPGTPVADLHALSLCDFIAGPPSSFSAWAAFHGRSRLLHIIHPAAPIEMADFVDQSYPHMLF